MDPQTDALINRSFGDIAAEELGLSDEIKQVPKSSSKNKKKKNNYENNDQQQPADGSRAYLMAMLEKQQGHSNCTTLHRAIVDTPGASLHKLTWQLQQIAALKKDGDISKELWRSLMLVYGVDVLKRLHELVMDVLLDVLVSLRSYSRYWNSKKETPYALLVQRGPTYWAQQLYLNGGAQPWLGHMLFLQKTQVSKRLLRIEHSEAEFVKKVGHLHEALAFLELADSFSSVEDFLVHAQDLHFLLTHQASSAPVTGPLKFLRLLENVIELVPPFRAKLCAYLQPLEKPSHLRRYWLHYSVAGVAATLAVAEGFLHRDQLTLQARNTSMSVSMFLREHLVDPVTSLLAYVFETFHTEGSPVDAELSARKSRHDLAHMLEEFGRSNRRQLATHYKQSEREFLGSLPDRAQNLDMDLVMVPYATDVKRPFSSALGGELVRELFIQVQKVKTDSEFAVVEVQRLLRANEINFQLLATIPAILIGYGLLWATNSLFQRPRRVAQIVRLRDHLMQVEYILISCSSKDKPTAIETGLMLVHLYMAKKCVQNVPRSARRGLFADLRTLKGTALSPAQKLLIMNRMYRSYVFLTSPDSSNT